MATPYQNINQRPPIETSTFWEMISTADFRKEAPLDLTLSENLNSKFHPLAPTFIPLFINS
jgi:hypothetical protein